MKELEAKHKKRLVHVLDVHWYPEARGTKRITDKDNSPKTVAARLQAPRSLWDPTYMEKSWIAGEPGKPIRLIPWLLEKIADALPGDEAGHHRVRLRRRATTSRAGSRRPTCWACSDARGSTWPTTGATAPATARCRSYIKAAFRLYRNYDGKRGTFGDTAVAATPADHREGVDLRGDRHEAARALLTVLVINKELRSIFNGKIAIKGGKYAKAQVYTLDAHAAPTSSRRRRST